MVPEVLFFAPLSCAPTQALLTNRAFQSLQPEILHLAPEGSGSLRLGLHSNHAGNSRPAENSQASVALLIIQLNFGPEAWSPGTRSPTLNFILTIILLCSHYLLYGVTPSPWSSRSSAIWSNSEVGVRALAQLPEEPL